MRGHRVAQFCGVGKRDHNIREFWDSSVYLVYFIRVGGFADQDDYELAWGLADTASGSLQPEYRFDVPVSLLQGGSTQVFVDTPGGPGRLGVRRMEVASTLKLRQMWMSGAQPSGLQYSGAAAAWTVSATFACSGWLPIPLQNQLY